MTGPKAIVALVILAMVLTVGYVIYNSHQCAAAQSEPSVGQRVSRALTEAEHSMARPR